MNRSEIAKNYFRTNTTPIQELCPVINQRWETSKGTVYWDSLHMKRTSSPIGTVTRWVPTVKNRYEGSYFRYVDELDALEVAKIYALGGRGQDGVPMLWNFSGFTSRVLLFRNDPLAYREDGEYGGCKYYSTTAKSLMMMLARNGYLQNIPSMNAEVNKMGAGFTEEVYPWKVREWYEKNWIPRTVSKHSSSLTGLQNLNEIEFPTTERRAAIVIQPVDDYMVLRRFNQDYRYNYQTGKYDVKGTWDEKYRVFVDKKGKPTVLRKDWRTNNVWKISTASIHEWSGNDREYKVMLVGANYIDDWDSLKYLKSVIDFYDNNCLETLVGTLRHPIVEQLAKAGYPKIAKSLQQGNEICATLKAMFRVERETKQPLYKLLGVNKWLLKAVEDVEVSRYNNRLNLVYMVKYLYDRFDVSDLSKETIDLLVSNLKNIDTYQLKELCGYRTWEYRRTRWNNVSDDTRNFILKLFRMNNKYANSNIIRTYIDTMNLYNRIDNKPDVDLRRFEDAHGLEIIHDALIEIEAQEARERNARYNEYKAKELEEQKKMFKKLQEDRVKRFNAESGKYLIKVPEALDEITKEGCALHHCVGGYLNNHAAGTTNIIFLRKKENPDTPFYTIEVRGNSIIQIHGSHNKWLGNDPEAIPFVYKWAKERNLRYDTNVFLNLGAGYSASKSLLDASYLTKEVV